MIKNGEIQFIVNTTEGEQAIADSFTIRRSAVSRKICYTTTLAGAEAACLALQAGDIGDVTSLQHLHGLTSCGRRIRFDDGEMVDEKNSCDLAWS